MQSDVNLLGDFIFITLISSVRSVLCKNESFLSYGSGTLPKYALFLQGFSFFQFPGSMFCMFPFLQATNGFVDCFLHIKININSTIVLFKILLSLWNIFLFMSVRVKGNSSFLSNVQFDKGKILNMYIFQHLT